jgi:Plavaka transposase
MLVERRPWNLRLNRRLPLRFRDSLPQAPPPPIDHLMQPPASPESESPVGLPPVLGSSADNHYSRSYLTTPRNIFGLSRKYESEKLLSHDPEEHVSLQDLSNFPIQAESGSVFYPYPNRSSFLLGDWFWNGGVQKSQSSFKTLLGIVCDPKFDTAEIRDTKWDAINNELVSDDQQEWMDENEDVGWMRTPVTISVPFHLRRGAPSDPKAGPKDFVIPGFYHRSLISIIREKLSHPSNTSLFHFEPYELTWKTRDDQEPIRVYGEIYTSPAFVDAHRKLQGSPPEPGCSLPRFIVSLMFWSDATHLTSFSDAKLWPLYMFFGNDSKYRRCKPSLHMGNHVAYFQTVSRPVPLLQVPSLDYSHTTASTCFQGFRL